MTLKSIKRLPAILNSIRSIREYNRILSTSTTAKSEFPKETSVFLIIGFGRSGTKFLANVLNKDPSSLVLHEPVALDKIAYLKSFVSSDNMNYISGYRKSLIKKNINKFKPLVYGEVNSYLRRHVKSLKIVFPSAQIFHLVRDGRDIVRSMMSRNTLSNEDLATFNFQDSSYNMSLPSNWNELDRFEKLCWYWRIEVEFLNKEISNFIKFEKILVDYDYFHKMVLIPTGVNITRNVWEKSVLKPKNKTVNHRFPPWNRWDEIRKDTFRRICGDIMNKLDYDLTHYQK